MKSYLFLKLLVISSVVSSQNTYNNDYFDCLSYQVLNHSKDLNCHQLALKFNISVLTLEAINPGLNCSDSLQNVYLVCSSAQNPKCLSSYSVLKNDSIDSILKKFNLNKKDLFEANPFLNSINQSKIVCIKRMEPSFVMNIHSSLTSLMHQVNNANSYLLNKFKSFIAKPTKSNAQFYQDAIIDLHRTNQSFKMIYKTFENSLDGKKLLVKKKLNNLCSQLDSRIYPKTSKCTCENKEPISYCSILFNDEIQQLKEQKADRVLFCEFMNH